MKINYSWIKEYIDTKKSLEETAELLTMSGSEVKAIEKIGDDYIMDIEITPNRSDCLSYIGIAREISALTGKTIKMPPLKAKREKARGMAPFTPLEMSKTQNKESQSLTGFRVEIKDKDLCARYTARLIRNVKVAESPHWLKEKIVSMGLRPVNNVVDITNYVLFELGQPMHAFDYDKIKGKAVIIRRARPGEKMISIDQTERPLDKDTLVIADMERPIAIGGVMGGLDTEVSGDTENLLLESAYFSPVSVRRTSFKLALVSESSYRFERGVDPGMVLPASDRAALLMADICGGKIGELVDKGANPRKDRVLSLRIERLNKILNLNLKEKYVKKILSCLSLEVTSPKKGIMKVSVPSFREDIKDEIDLIEEVARIYGYENIAMTIPRIIANPERKSSSWKAREKARDLLTSLGLSEVVTYGLLGRQAMDKVFGDFTGAISVKNPLSAEQELMRASLIPGALNVISYNANRGIKDIKIFELGAVYHRKPDRGYSERMNLCIALTGAASGDWQRQRGNVTFFDLKGVLETLFRELGLKDFTMAEAPRPFLTKDASSDILYEGKSVGGAGCLSANLQNDIDLNQEVFVAEIDFDSLAGSMSLDRRFADIPKFPSIKRDISLIAGGDISFEKITSLVKEEGGKLVRKIELFDQYTGRQIPAGRHGLTVRVEYRDREKTLTTEDVDRVHSAIRKSLAEKLGIALR